MRAARGSLPARRRSRRHRVHGQIDVTRFASVAWGYEVNSPLWSDQADKERAFVLPLGLERFGC